MFLYKILKHLEEIKNKPKCHIVDFDPDSCSDAFSGFNQRKFANMVMFTTGISIFATISAVIILVFGIIGNNRRN